MPKSVWFEWNSGTLRKTAVAVGGAKEEHWYGALMKTFIIAGGNTGLGFECACALSKDGSVLASIACRDVQKGEQSCSTFVGNKGHC